MKKSLMFLLVALAVFSAPGDANACGSHGGCGGGVGVHVGVYGRPGIVGGGAVAFRRARRLARRSRRAAFFGFYGRSARLGWRANAAFGRGMYRAGY